MNFVMARRTPRADRFFLLLVLCSIVSACSHEPAGRLARYPVKGKVLYRGKPLVDALVVFEKTGGSPAVPDSKSAEIVHATGRTGGDGGFTLMTYTSDDGAPAGDYKVAVSSVPARSETGLFSPSSGTPSKGNPDVLRGRYSDPKTSGLSAQVKEQENELPTFDLK